MGVSDLEVLLSFSGDLPLLEVECAALDLGGDDDTVLPELRKHGLQGAEVSLVRLQVPELLGTELLDQRAGAYHGVLPYGGKDLVLGDFLHGYDTPIQGINTFAHTRKIHPKSRPVHQLCLWTVR